MSIRRPKLGPRLASGRSADIYSYGSATVLRRYRNGRAGTLDEAALMQHLLKCGFPVPEVYEVTSTDMVMERVAAPTMLEAMASNPFSLHRHASVLAHLHQDLHGVSAPQWPLRPFGEGTSILHLDLHPANVLVTDHGPVVIDWSNAAIGPAGADPALAWILLSCGNPPGGPLTRAFVGLARKLFVKSFIGHFDLGDLRVQLGLASSRVRNDRNLAAFEQARISRFLEREAQSTSTVPPALQ